jgi:tRNA pseudouridine32 synthase/23S rRNA pseudouridine746 synthase
VRQPRPPLVAANLPLRDGVGAGCVALPEGGWPTVLAFLQARFPMISPQAWLDRMTAGAVLADTGEALLPQAPFRPHQKIFYYRSLPAEQPIPFTQTVLFQDDFLVAVDKPHFLPVTPGGAYVQQTLLVRLKRSLGIATLAPMHRLDRDTAGVMLFSIQPATRNGYQALFRERRIDKRYEAIARRRPDLVFPLRRQSRLEESSAFMQMHEVPGVPNADTLIDVLAVEGDAARYSLHPSTGQKHQLRAHMAALGMPIFNDRIYPVLEAAPDPTAPPDYRHPLQLLARSLAFIDPFTGQARYFESRKTLPLSGECMAPAPAAAP